MKKIICILSAAAMLLMTSCGKKETANNADNSLNDSILLVDQYNDNYSSGRIIGGIDSSHSSIGTPSMYVDYASMEKVIMCSKPNCTHTSVECPARIMGTAPIMTNDSIYFFDCHVSIKEEKNGRRYLDLSSRLCKMSLDSSEVETVARFTDCTADNSRGYVLYDNKIYFTGDDQCPTYDEYGNLHYSNVGGKHFICSIDLDTGEYINYGLIFDDSGYEGAPCSSSAILRGVYDSKLIIDYSFAGTLNDAAFGNFTTQNYAFDFETNEWSLMDIPSYISHVDNDTLVYYDYDAEKCIILKNDVRTELDIGEVRDSALMNGKLFVRDDSNNFALKWYDLADMSEHFVDGYDAHMPAAMYDDCYILTRGNATEKLSEKELLAVSHS